MNTVKTQENSTASAFPEHWVSPQNQAQLRRRIQQSSAAILMLDYDGTLAPFQDDKMRAYPYPGIEHRLERILKQPKNRLVLVTGRPAEELIRLLPIANQLEVWGSHGRERILPDGTYELSPLAPEQSAVLDAIDEHLRTAGHGESIERKPTSLAVHWRMLPLQGQKELQTLACRLFEQHAAGSGFQPLAFENGVEFRTCDRTKRNVVTDLLRSETRSPLFAAYLGDDTTDEDAFRAIAGHGLSLLVRDEVRTTQADYWLRPPDDLLAFLDLWIEAGETNYQGDPR